MAIKAEIIVAAKDEASGKMNEINSGMDGMATKAADVSAKFLLIKGAIEQAVSMVQQFTEGAVSFDQAVTRSSIAMDDASINADVLTTEIKSLADATLDGLYSHTETAEAFNKIADEGRGLAGTLDIVKNAMNLTAVQGGDLAETSNMIESIMSAMNLKIEDAGRITDVLNTTWKNTGTTAAEIAPSLINMGQMFSSLGWSIEESTALIGVFKDLGQESVTGLLSAFTQLANEGSLVSKKFEEMGVSVKNADGSLKTMPDLFAAIESAGFTATDMLTAFGLRGSGAMVAAVENLGEVVEVTEANMESFGDTVKDAGEYGESAAADFQRTEAGFNDMKDELARGLLPMLQNLMNIIRPVMDLFTEYPALIYAVVGALILYKIHASWAAITTTASAVAHYAKAAAMAVSTAATGAATGAQWLLNAAMYANPVLWLVAGIVALVAVLVLFGDEIGASIGSFGAWVAEVAGFDLVSEDFKRDMEEINGKIREQKEEIDKLNQSYADLSWAAEQYQGLIDEDTRKRRENSLTIRQIEMKAKEEGRELTKSETREIVKLKTENEKLSIEMEKNALKRDDLQLEQEETIALIKEEEKFLKSLEKQRIKMGRKEIEGKLAGGGTELGVLEKIGGMLGFKEGGYVPDDMIAQLHAGELVLNAEQVKNIKNSSSTSSFSNDNRNMSKTNKSKNSLIVNNYGGLFTDPVREQRGYDQLIRTFAKKLRV